MATIHIIGDCNELVFLAGNNRVNTVSNRNTNILVMEDPGPAPVRDDKDNMRDEYWEETMRVWEHDKKIWENWLEEEVVREEQRAKERALALERKEGREAVDTCLATVTNEWSLSRIAKECTPYGWDALFDGKRKTLDHIENIIGTNFVPNREDVFNPFVWTPLYKVRVLILGQDPYHKLLNDGTPQAVGAAFSTRRHAPLQPSIRNMYKEISRTIPEFETPSHGDLKGWTDQGVLLMNASWTTRPGKAGAHECIWNGLTTRVFKLIRESRPNTIVLLWGNSAQKYIQYMGRLKVLTSSHPSPLSAHKGFSGCGHFLEVNQYLTSIGEQPIDWNLR